jgi:hypothetical protein
LRFFGFFELFELFESFASGSARETLPPRAVVATARARADLLAMRISRRSRPRRFHAATLAGSVEFTETSRNHSYIIVA